MGLAPLVLISVGGVAAMPFVPFVGVALIVVALTVNAAGAVGDLYMVVWLLTKPGPVLVCDVGTSITIYGVPRE